VRYAGSSFRDPDARVLALEGDRVTRVLSAAAAATDDHLRGAGVLDGLERDGLLIASTRCTDRPLPDGWAALIETPRLPFVSYPYEWSFGMLRDAALLTLRLTERALAHGAMLKDASGFNVLFDGTVPLFVDVTSLARYQDDSPWIAYGQFCDHFLAPLLLEAYKGVPFQPFLRGSLAGLSIAAQLAPLLSARDVLRPGALAHVGARAVLERSTRRLDTSARRAVRRMPVPKASVLRNLQALQRLVGRLTSRAASEWARYDAAPPYDESTAARKAAFVGTACERVGGGRLAWDLGANTGRYSRLLARHYRSVVALDADAGAIDRLYAALRGSEHARTVLPLVVDLMDPSPARGWRGRERAALWDRGRPDFALYLALTHHLCLGRGVPLDELVELIADTSPAAVVEFVAADDPMSQALLATRPTTHPGYDLSNFRSLAAQRFRILAEETLTPTRQLFLLAR
jgi:hypothetical protein